MFLILPIFHRNTELHVYTASLEELPWSWSTVLTDLLAVPTEHWSVFVSSVNTSLSPAAQNWSFFNKSSIMPGNNGFILPLSWSAKIIGTPTAPNWDRENGTVLVSETDNRWFNFLLRQKFLFSKATRTALGSTEPSVQRVPKALSPKVKGLRREAKHSPQPGVEVNNSWCYTSMPPPVFRGGA